MTFLSVIDEFHKLKNQYQVCKISSILLVFIICILLLYIYRKKIKKIFQRKK